MLNDHRQHTAEEDHDEPHSIDIPEVRDILPLTPTAQYPSRGRRRDQLWEGGSSHSIRSDASASEHLSTMSREFNAMVVAGSTLHQNNSDSSANGNGNTDDEQNQLARIGEDTMEETNPLAIVPNPIPSPARRPPSGGDAAGGEGAGEGAGDGVAVHVVKREEVESKVAAWQTAEVAKINNRYKREEVIINGWEGEQVEKAAAWLKKVERKLDEQRARAFEKMQNDVAKAHHKAAEKKASAEAKRGTKVARVLELANFMRAVGRAPSKRSFF